MKPTPHILYIEDNEYNQRLIKKILEPIGYPITQALDGLQGIKKAIDLKPDLVLLDLDLPNLDGFGVATKLKSVSGLENVPIVALTNKASCKDRERALAAGCDGYIEKPINAARFPGQIQGYLDGKREISQADPSSVFKDFNVNLVDQLQHKLGELETTNRELVQKKDELQASYRESRHSNIELQRLNRLKENIITITSHELRTPLSVTKGYIELLLENMLGDLNDEQAQVLQICQQNMAMMGELIDKISDLSRITAKKMTVNLSAVDLNQLFRAVQNELSVFMKIRNLSMDWQLSKEAPVVLGDPELLHQVFTNLLKNAISFTPDGGHITARSWVEGEKAFFQLADDGVGIKDEDLERIFDEFYQVHDITHHKSGQFEFLTRGIGVGLALSRRGIHELGGEIKAESEGPDKGSQFTFFLPLDHAA